MQIIHRKNRTVLITGALFACLGVFATMRCFAEEPQPADSAKSLANTLEMKMIMIPGGKFSMGCGKDFNDKPVREVTITKSFYIGACEVSQKQFKEIMGFNPSWYAYKGDEMPVEGATWFEAVEFCKRLGKREGKKYRLPTEAEWEYACKAGANWMVATNSNLPEGVLDYAWTPENTDTKPHKIGTKKPNPWGLHDTIGNVYEWCSDWYNDVGYQGAAVIDPQGPEKSSNLLGSGGKVVRGGSSLGGLMNCLRLNRCSSTARNSITPYAAQRSVGFRVVCEAVAK